MTGMIHDKTTTGTEVTSRVTWNAMTVTVINTVTLDSAGIQVVVVVDVKLRERRIPLAKVHKLRPLRVIVVFPLGGAPLFVARDIERSVLESLG